MHSKHALLFSCVDINECVEAAMNNQQICNMTQSCENTLGSVQCICPGGTQLNMQGECMLIPLTMQLHTVVCDVIWKKMHGHNFHAKYCIL